MEITTLAERPHLESAVYDLDVAWPEFVSHDPISESFWSAIPTTFPDFVLVATEGPDLIARGFSVPFAARAALPATGWDQVLIWAFKDHNGGVAPNTVSAIEIAIRRDQRGNGLSTAVLAAMRDNVRAHGLTELVAPVRPNHKYLEPATPMSEYAFRTREDGLPYDPWLRVHVRAGGVIDSIAPASMVVTGSLNDWRSWTDLPFDRPGPTQVPGALSPVHCDTESDHAVYVEPNVWIRHTL